MNDAISHTDTLRYESLIDGLLTNGYGIMDNFLSLPEIAALGLCLQKRHAAGEFRSAGVGNQQVTVKTTIRGDKIGWLNEATATAAELAFLQRIGLFVQYLNQTCYLGLQDHEFHYALYPTGTSYKRHLDRFRSDSRRKLSVICYLNTNWQEADGGQLTLYLPAAAGPEQPIMVMPVGGRLVCFDSGQLEHEVFPATRERLSLTGWLKTA